LALLASRFNASSASFWSLAGLSNDFRITELNGSLLKMSWTLALLASRFCLSSKYFDSLSVILGLERLAVFSVFKYGFDVFSPDSSFNFSLDCSVNSTQKKPLLNSLCTTIQKN